MHPLKKPIIWILLSFMIFLPACAGSPQSAQEATRAPTINLTDCQLSAPGSSLRMSAKCGTLSVPENRDSPESRMIDLNIAVIPAVSRNPAPDPLFFLTGGPGQAATQSYLQLYFAFNRINQKREIILVDQRGTGKSHPLECIDDEMTDDSVEQTRSVLTRCLQNLDADPAFYTTSIAMQDLDDVRAALGYDKINLYGLSYGTRAALTYLANFPGNVRTVILDGVVPQDEALGLDVAADAQRALDLILTRCENDTACKQAFPNIRQEMQNLLNTLRVEPKTVTIPHPVSGEDTELEFTSDEMASAIRLLSYTPETVALLPLLIHNASQMEDYSLLAAEYLIVAGQLSDTITNGMGFSVLCAEDVPFITPQAAEDASRDTYIGTAQTDQLFEVCDVWPRGEVSANFKQPVRSEVPTLILSGEADPVTPPSNGDRVALGLPNSLHLVAPGQGHNVIYRGCLPRIASAFVESGSTQSLDTACVDSIQPMPFFINFAGPKP